MKLSKLKPKDDSDETKGPFKRCSLCKGRHFETQIKGVGYENDLGLWFLCDCGTCVLWTKEEQENPAVADEDGIKEPELDQALGSSSGGGAESGEAESSEAESSEAESSEAESSEAESSEAESSDAAPATEEAEDED